MCYLLFLSYFLRLKFLVPFQTFSHHPSMITNSECLQWSLKHRLDLTTKKKNLFGENSYSLILFIFIKCTNVRILFSLSQHSESGDMSFPIILYHFQSAFKTYPIIQSSPMYSCCLLSCFSFFLKQRTTKPPCSLLPTKIKRDHYYSETVISFLLNSVEVNFQDPSSRLNHKVTFDCVCSSPADSFSSQYTDVIWGCKCKERRKYGSS